jgi:thiamine biosynthesis lipoprotein
VVQLQDRALATSGDYRIFLEDPERNRHHILDPRTGTPADHPLASVSVLAADCMTADAVATALFVMGTEEGLRWLSDHPELEALFIDRTEEGFRFSATPGFGNALVAVP